MSTKTSPLVVKVKKEVPSEEINDFAETAMNELLGWYGYGNVDRSELSKNSRLQTSDDIKSKSSTMSIGVRATSSTPERYSSPDNSRSPILRKIIDRQDVDCGWCRRPVSMTTPEFLATPEGPRYCTESCFAQSRRASFKRAKTCDWCKHIRHAVSYVDFQDGASQLQFCSDKCLNQYKMQIFCKETQAHIDMNPHLKDKGSEQDGGLITPDLWLKNCRSRSTSPNSDCSVTASPPPPPSSASSKKTITSTIQTSALLYKPIITVAPSSKLMSRPPPPMTVIRKSPKPARKRRSLRLYTSLTNSVNRNNNHNINNNNNNNKTTDNSIVITAKPSTLTNIQDLSVNSQKSQSNECTPTKRSNNPQHNFLPPPPNLFPLRHPLAQGLRFMHHQHQQQHAPPPPPPPPPPVPPPTPHQEQSRLFGATPPPVTILVPYPIVLPIPIPIPIPMPIIEFLRAAQAKLDLKNNPTYTDDKKDVEEPLDCSKSKESEQNSPQNSFTKLDNSEKPEHTISICNSPISVKDDGSQEQRLPKFKITRLNSKRTISKESSDSSRPLRKRKRIVDCDYLKLKEDDKKKV